MKRVFYIIIISGFAVLSFQNVLLRRNASEWKHTAERALHVAEAWEKFNRTNNPWLTTNFAGSITNVILYPSTNALTNLHQTQRTKKQTN